MKASGTQASGTQANGARANGKQANGARATSLRSTAMARAASPPAPDPTGLIELQRVAGNRAVRSLLSSPGGVKEAAPAVGNPALLRLLERRREADLSGAEARAVAAERGASGAPIGLPASQKVLPGGEALEDGVRAEHEATLRADLSSVRVHTDLQTARTVESMGAAAMAVGRDIAFAPGRFAPKTGAGRALLAHELRHVVDGSSAEAAQFKPADAPLAIDVPLATDAFDETIAPWNNPALRDTIYPFRDTALSQFLRLYEEIDLASGIGTPDADIAAETVLDEQNGRAAEKEKSNAAYSVAKKVNDTAVMARERAQFASAAADVTFLGKMDKLVKGKPLTVQQRKIWTAYRHSKYADSGRLLGHDELLAKVMKVFDTDPSFTRFPKWVRYMVINFSGMRYEPGAHNSYGSTVNLVRRLAADSVTARLQAESQDDIAAEADKVAVEISASTAGAKQPVPATAKRLDALRAVATAHAKAFAKPDELAIFDEIEAARKKKATLDPNDDTQAAQAAELDAIIDAKTSALGAPRVKKAEEAIATAEATRRAAVRDFALDKAARDLASLDNAHALSVLEKMHTAGSIPEWVWRQIVRRTLLRAKYAGSDWETPSTEETAAEKSNDPAIARWRSILDAWWQSIDKTSWREKHARDLSLVMMAARCNEISEAAQHALGEKEISGGIAQKAKWYTDMSTGRTFVRPTTESQLVPGTTIFWLEWSTIKPDDPIKRVLLNSAFDLREESGRAIVDGATIGDSTYHVDAEGNICRVRTIRVMPPIKTISSSYDYSSPQNLSHLVEQRYLTEYLKWKHEATVVELDHERQRVLTFETSFPTSINVRQFSEILGKWNVLIGFAPAGTEPANIGAFIKTDP